MNPKLKASIEDFIEALIQFEKDKKVWKKAHKEPLFIPIYNATSVLSDEVDLIDDKIFTNRFGDVDVFLKTLRTYGPVPDNVLQSAEIVLQQLRLNQPKDKPISWIAEIILTENTPQIHRDIAEIARQCPSVVKVLEDGFTDEYGCVSKEDLIDFAEKIKAKLESKAHIKLLDDEAIVGILFVQQKLGATLLNYEYYNQFDALDDKLEEEKRIAENKRVYNRKILDTIENEKRHKLEDDLWHQKYLDAIRQINIDAEEKQERISKMGEAIKTFPHPKA